MPWNDDGGVPYRRHRLELEVDLAVVLHLMRGLAQSNAGSTGITVRVLVQAEAPESERGLFHGGGGARLPWQIGAEREGERCGSR